MTKLRTALFMSTYSVEEAKKVLTSLTSAIDMAEHANRDAVNIKLQAENDGTITTSIIYDDEEA